MTQFLFEHFDDVTPRKSLWPYDQQCLTLCVSVVERRYGVRRDVAHGHEGVLAPTLSHNGDLLACEGRAADHGRDPRVHEGVRLQHRPRHAAGTKSLLGLTLRPHE